MSSWNGKIICTQSFYGNVFNEQEIYNIKNGCFQKGIFDKEFENIDEINSYFSAKFEEITENNYVNLNKRCNYNVSKSDLPNKIPVLCEILNVEPLKKFGIQLSKEKYYIDTYGHLLTECGTSKDEYVPYLISGEYKIVKLPFYSFAEDERIIMKGLLLNDYNYIARDEDNDLWAYQLKPLEDESGEYDADDGDFSKLNNGFFKQVQWGNVLDIKAEIDRLN